MVEITKPPFVFYSCAYLPKSYAPLGAWVKYRPGPQRVELIDRAPGWTHLSCPDREILLVRNAHTMASARPLDMGWDEFVPFSLTNTHSAEAIPFDRYMVNFFQHLSRPKGEGAAALPRANDAISANLRLPDSVVRDGKTVVADSGGFQLMTGKTEWIDPVDLGRWYARNCDEGITLDIPVHGELERDYLLRSAHVQVENTKIVQAQLPEGFGLFNVAHGLSDDGNRRFREIVEKDGPDRYLCIAGAYHGNIMQSLGRLTGRILDPDFKTYEQYHILGVYNVAMLIPIIRFAALMRKQGKNFTISSDASTAVYSAGNRTMHLQRAHWRSAERLMLGRSAPISEPNPFRHLPCSCPVCSTFKYTDIISHVDDAAVAHSFMIHNMIEIDRWVKQTVHYAETLDANQYSQLAMIQLGSRAAKTAERTLRFVETVAAEGHAAAMKEFAPYMAGLFSYEEVQEQSGGGMQLDSEDDVGRGTMPVQPPGYYENRLDKVLTRFEKYHTDGGNPPALETKKEDMKRTVRKVMMNTTVTEAGSRKIAKKVVTKPATEGQSTHTKPATKRGAGLAKGSKASAA